MALEVDTPALRLFLDGHIPLDSIISRIARGEDMADSKFQAALKRTANRFCRNPHNREVQDAIRAEYERRRAENAAQSVKR